MPPKPDDNWTYHWYTQPITAADTKDTYKVTDCCGTRAATIWTADNLENVRAWDKVANYYNVKTPFLVQYITQEELDQFANKLAKRIYKIISEHTNINISEDEFMSLLKEGE